MNLSIPSQQAAHVNTWDLEDGNTSKGLSGALGIGQGPWRLSLYSSSPLRGLHFLPYVRTEDGFVTSMHDTAPGLYIDGIGANHHVPIFNPSSNTNQVSQLLLFNWGSGEAAVTIYGVDDEGATLRKVTTALPPGDVTTYTAADLEMGAETLVGRFGDGTGKWRLWVKADQPMTVMSLLDTPTGHLTNLSTSRYVSSQRDHFFNLFPSGGWKNDVQSFVRIINYSTEDGEASLVHLSLRRRSAEEAAAGNKRICSKTGKF